MAAVRALLTLKLAAAARSPVSGRLRPLCPCSAPPSLRAALHGSAPRSGARVALVLSGCGVYDGTEIHEASAVLVHLSRGGAEVQIFAPDILQMHVIDHTKGQPSESESRAQEHIPCIHIDSEPHGLMELERWLASGLAFLLSVLLCGSWEPCSRQCHRRLTCQHA